MSVRNSGSHDLIDGLIALPENSWCADCGEKNPRYVNGMIGVFVCRPCADAHKRVLDPAQIRSLDTGLRDLWPPSFVTTLTSVGNKLANKLWEAAFLSDESLACFRPTGLSPPDYRDSWVSAKYVHRLFCEFRKGFVVVTPRIENAQGHKALSASASLSSKPQLSFAVVKAKQVAFHNAEYGSQQADTLITEMEGSTITLTPIVYSDSRKKKGSFEVKTWHLSLKIEPHGEEQNLQEWFEALQTLHGRAMFCLTHKPQERPPAPPVAVPPIIKSSSGDLTHSIHSSSHLTSPSATPERSLPTRITSPSISLGTGLPQSASSVNGVLMFSYRGHDLLYLTKSDPLNMPPPVLVAAGTDGSVSIEVVTLGLLPSLRQKGAIVHLQLTKAPVERAADTIVYVHPALREAEIRIVIPPHLQRGAVVEVDGRIKVTLNASVTEEIILISKNNK